VQAKGGVSLLGCKGALLSTPIHFFPEFLYVSSFEVPLCRCCLAGAWCALHITHELFDAF